MSLRVGATILANKKNQIGRRADEWIDGCLTYPRGRQKPGSARWLSRATKSFQRYGRHALRAPRPWFCFRTPSDTSIDGEGLARLREQQLEG